MTALIDGYDTALFDLDGVIYLGPDAVPGATAALAEVVSSGTRVMYVTNNAARPVQVVIDQLQGLGFAADEASVLTSAQVAASALAQDLPGGAKILVCGSANLAALLARSGFRIVESATEQPDAVIQGYDPDLNWRRLDEAALAIQSGARWYATNADASRPTDRGLVPGVGGAIAVLSTALGGSPTIFGKPYRPMLDQALLRTGAERAIFVGDRLDTDIVGAVAAGLDSLMVFSGAHGKADLVSAKADAHPNYIGADVGALLQPARTATVVNQTATCREQVAKIRDGRVHLHTRASSMEEQLDALWAIAQLVWIAPEADARAALSGLELVR